MLQISKKGIPILLLAIGVTIILIVQLTLLPRISDNLTNISENRYKFIILTKSAPQSLEDRNLLRSKSWLSYPWKNDQLQRISWRHFFLVGLSMDPDWSRTAMEEEHKIYGDIIVSQTLDNYRRLTYKLMWGLQHMVDNYDFNFLVVLSEDTIVNVNGLDTYLSGLIDEGRDKLFYGGPHCIKRIVGRTGYKVTTTKDQWPLDFYPYYCMGSGLIFSFDTLVELLQLWFADRQPNNGLDDVQIGNLLFMSGKITQHWVTNVTNGCLKGSSDSFIVTQIKPLEKGVELMRNYWEHGIYCFEDVPYHKH